MVKRNCGAPIPEEELTEYELIRRGNMEEIKLAMAKSGTFKDIRELKHQITNNTSLKLNSNKNDTVSIKNVKVKKSNSTPGNLKTTNNMALRRKRKAFVQPPELKKRILRKQKHTTCTKMELQNLRTAIQLLEQLSEVLNKKSRDSEIVLNFDNGNNALGKVEISAAKDSRPKHNIRGQEVEVVALTKQRGKHKNDSNLASRNAEGCIINKSCRDESKGKSVALRNKNNQSKNEDIPFNNEMCDNYCVYVNEQNGKSVSGQVSNICNECGHYLIFRRSLTLHMKDKHNMKKKFKCDTCSYIVGNKNDFIQHMESRHLGVKHPCDKCNYSGTRKFLARHQRAVHNDLRPYLCYSCGFAAKRKEVIDNHVKKKHNEENISPDVSLMWS